MAAQTLSKQADITRFFAKYMLEVILVVLFILMSLTTRGFFTVANLFNVLRNISLQGCIAFGMCMVIISGEIDISIGSTVALTGVIIGIITNTLSKAAVMSQSAACVVGILLAFIVAVAIGFFQGFIRVKFDVPTLIISLAMQYVIYGIAALISGGFPVTKLPSWYNVFGAGRIAGVIPVPALVLILVFIVFLIWMGYTKFGRSVYAVGGNAESARLSGISVKRVKITAMVAVQVCSAISGVLVSSQVMSGSFSFGKGWEMTAIAAVIIGGASLAGGTGTVARTMVGLVILGIITNWMTLQNVNEYGQYVVRGGLILAAVIINTIQTQRKT
jgi:ribose/xylose/arabinose/galactoside ABC-type transport system permease subunit